MCCKLPPFKLSDSHSLAQNFSSFKLDQTNLLLSRVPCQRLERPSDALTSDGEIRKTLETLGQATTSSEGEGSSRRRASCFRLGRRTVRGTKT